MKASANIVLDSVGNRTLVCHDPHKISSNGLWTNENPLNYSTPLLLMQLSLVSLTSMLIDVIIKPLGQSTIVSQIFVSMRHHDMRYVYESFQCLIVSLASIFS